MAGAGDLLAIVLKHLGIDLDVGCSGCQRRRKLLNKMFPFPAWMRRGAGH